MCLQAYKESSKRNKFCDAVWIARRCYNPPMQPKVALVCDWLVSHGGAERVISAIASMFPTAPIFTTIYNESLFPEYKDRVVTSFINKLPGSRMKHHLFLPLMPYAVEQFNLSEFDIVISSSHSCAKGIITKPSTLHICYCHTPMRYCWGNFQEYFDRFGVPAPLKKSARKILHQLRLWDKLAADRVDRYIANCAHVSARISKYYRKDSQVIYPPIYCKKFVPAAGGGVGGYFLAVGRLTPYKRFDLLVDTFNELKMPLVIVGRGPQEKELKNKAGRFITFLGHISDDELVKVYQNSLALVFPQEEDFGLIPLEAMSCGKPVIAYGKGGALETVIVGKTGLFFYEQTAESLKKAVLECGALKWNSLNIRSHAEQFDLSIFEKKLKNFVDEEWEKWRKKMIV